MPIRHYIAPDQPILYSVLYDKIEIDEIMETFELVNQIIIDRELPMIYWIGDTTCVDVNHTTMLQAVEATLSGVKGTGGDPRVIPLLIMEDALYEFFVAELRNRYDRAEFPKFTSAHDAYKFVKFLTGLQDK